jgi:hypothetical protein
MKLGFTIEVVAVLTNTIQASVYAFIVDAATVDVEE